MNDSQDNRSLSDNVYTFDISSQRCMPETIFRGMGGSNPEGDMLDVNSKYLTYNGTPFLPVMGEMHYSRYPADYWEEELLKMKACGIQIVATYIFWNHHEESEGKHEWTDSRNIRKFSELCAMHGLFLYLRLGPYCHGEVRYGGFPDWVINKCRIRTNDSVYLTYVHRHYEQIFGQVQGMLFKDGGPIIGVQIENEYLGGQEHMSELKNIAISVGFDVPFYSATAAGGQFDSIPEGEMLPMFGGYPEAPWAQHTDPMPPSVNFFFSHLRDDSNVGNDLITTDLDKRGLNPPGIERYPYFMCELGSGNQVTYHRRPIISADDIVSMALVKIGSGCNWPGYYMFHGGTNPVGKLSTLHESQSTGYPNNYPILSYDFQSPIGEYGQIREAYHELKLLHMFLRDFGERLAPMESILPKQQPIDRMDKDTLKCVVRSDGYSGFLFLNNYVRSQETKQIGPIRFEFTLADGEKLLFPQNPVTIPKGERAIFPFNMPLEGGALLHYATAQLFARLEHNGKHIYIFFALSGIQVECALEGVAVNNIETSGNGEVVSQHEGKVILSGLKAGTDCLLRLTTADGTKIEFLIMTKLEALHCYKSEIWGKERLFLSESDLLFEKEQVRLLNKQPGLMDVAVLPAPPQRLLFKNEEANVCIKGPFSHYSRIVKKNDVTVKASALADGILSYDGVQHEVKQWSIRFEAEDFDQCELGINDIFLLIEYEGDFAVLRKSGEKELLADHFYTGSVWEIGLKRFMPGIMCTDLLLQIIPLKDPSAIYLERKPSTEGQSIASLLNVKTATEYTAGFHM
ncbi:beta-galactosidase [Paenibacillus sp. EC2-1]|uniref:beta-galactosidase n=1 Tax=Paenibacillus sp. EC2-1 TaxID=3388665 RepID=UPI003BEEEDEA